MLRSKGTKCLYIFTAESPYRNCSTVEYLRCKSQEYSKNRNSNWCAVPQPYLMWHIKTLGATIFPSPHPASSWISIYIYSFMLYQVPSYITNFSKEPETGFSFDTCATNARGVEKIKSWTQASQTEKGRCYSLKQKCCKLTVILTLHPPIQVLLLDCSF